MIIQGRPPTDRSSSHGVRDDSEIADLNGVDAPGSSATTEVLTVGGFVSGVASGADQDWYRITLVAGTQYTFQVYTLGGTGPDPTLTLRNASSVAVAFNDDFGGSLDSQITYTAPTSGVYFLDVRQFESSGSLIYGLSASQTFATADAVPGNTSTSATLALGGSVTGLIETNGDEDWYGVQLVAGQRYAFTLNGFGSSPLTDPYLALHNSSGGVLAINDDGGTDLNSLLYFTPATSGVYYLAAQAWSIETGHYSLSAATAPPQNILDAIDWGTTRVDTTIEVYFATTGQTFDSFTATRSWTPAEIATAMAAMGCYSNYINVTFTQTNSAANADFVMVLSSSLDALGRMDPPPADPSIGVFTLDPSYWNAGSLLPGGAAYSTIIHEVGHALGLAHPHDNGGSSEVLDGVTDAYGSYGIFGLNQGVFTVMSYNDGYPSEGLAGSINNLRGYSYTPMALDVGVLQERYGATDHNAGDTTYVLGQIEGFGLIWDTGGTDTISASGVAFQSVNIDLRPATLLAEAGGGGFVSNVRFSGFTIANGVTIENAVGGIFNDRLVGNEVANRLTGGDGDDWLDGRENVDTAVFAGNRAQYSITRNNEVFFVSGPTGSDTLLNIEFAEFDDQTVRLRPGPGSAVSFSADPNTFMGAIRDFDGNDLGGNVVGELGWVLAGQVDLQGDGDLEYLFFNRAIGRWASVGPAEDGLVYFSDHSWAGDTRVVGLYIDPLVQSGEVVQGSDHDSQRRFQNDLFIGNIDGILGAGDYDDDGLQEIYFSLADGTAYLHAYMHVDGNIRYANYQSEEQVIDFLTSNGFGAETYEGWFD